MIKLEKQFDGVGEVKNFTFTQVAEMDNGYVYKVDTGDSVHYEAFLRKDVPICLDFKNHIYSETEKKEVYPKSKDFGIWAWTVKNVERGLSKCSATMNKEE
jgi:hypothetical protein